MKVSKNSFWYRLATYVTEDAKRDNVCSLVRGILINTLILIVLMAGGIFVFGALVVGPIVTALTFLLYPENPSFVAGGWRSLGFGGALGWGVVGLSIGFEITKEFFSNKAYERKSRSPSIFMQWIKDKHDKVCTKVELVE